MNFIHHYWPQMAPSLWAGYFQARNKSAEFTNNKHTDSCLYQYTTYDGISY